MIKIIITFLSYLLILFNTNLLAEVKNSKLRIGLLAPFSGDYKKLGDSLLLSTQLALEEIGDKNIIIIPRDSGSDNKEKLNIAIEEIRNTGAKIIIGPMDSSLAEELEKYNDTIFISLSNISPKISKNVINIGISLDSQLNAIEKFIIEQKKKKTIIMYPKNKYEGLVDKKIKLLKLKNYKVFKYNTDPKLITGEIEKLTNYSQRKRNLENRINLLKNKEDEKSIKELEKMEQLYTLGRVNFDSLIIIDFGSNLKSVLASLVFADVDDKEVLFTTVNQWFDESIFYENSVKNLYYPSVNLQNFKKYNKKFISNFNEVPNEVTILAYDALGLIYYIWNKNKSINSVKDFFIKEKIKGKIGTFQFKDQKVYQELKIYKTENKKFIEF
tara:strand:+ start:551 stop:1705 length:1155 start_codon:yes stop_codon:yes gene_type:complete